jgi:chromosome segregation ATPase
VSGSDADLKTTIVQAIGYDVDGLLKELEELPKRIYALRQKINPLRSEMRMLQERFASKGRSSSHYDLQRLVLLSELKEEARVLYRRDPEFKEDSKGRTIRIELTDGRAEDIAHAHPRYRKFIEEADAERKRISEINKELGPLFDKIEVWRGRKEFLVNTIEIAKAMVYGWNASTKLT